MNQLNYQHNDVESCKKPSSSAKTVEFLLRDRSSSAKTVEFCENRRVLAQTSQSSLTRSNRCNSGRVITSVKRSNVGPPKLTFFFLMGDHSSLSSLVLFSSKNQILFHHFLADAVPNVVFVM